MDEIPPPPPGYVLDPPPESPNSDSDPDGFKGFGGLPKPIPPPPEGYVLDNPNEESTGGVPPPPPGYVLDSELYSTPMQQLGAAAEGVAQGVAGPLATAAELGLSKMGVPGMSADEISGRAAANPWTHGIGEAVGLAGGLLTGYGEANLIGGIAKKLVPEATTAIGKVGAMAMSNAIQSGLIQGSDEISNAMLGKGDPSHPVSAALANVGASGLFGLGSGAIFGVATQGVKSGIRAVENTKFGENAKKYLFGLGLASSLEPKQFDAYLDLMNQKGSDAWEKRGFNHFAFVRDKAAGYVEGLLLSQFGTGHDSLSEKALRGLVGGWFGSKASTAMHKHLGPVLYKLLSTGEIENMGESLSYYAKARQGESKINNSIKNMFDFGSNKAAIELMDPKSHLEGLDEFLDKDGLDEQIKDQFNKEENDFKGFAKGGQVKHPQHPDEHHGSGGGIAAHFPEQNVLLNTAKGRVFNYLKSVRPIPGHMQSKLPFDAETKDHSKEKEYRRSLELAAQPLQILNHVKSGSLLPGHMKAFTQMYPELYGHLSKKITGEMTQRSLDKKQKPPYKVRQSMSLFLGSALDSTMTPMSIQAAQNAFVMQKAQGQAPKSTASLSKMGQNAMTPEQSRTRRLNKS